MVAKSCSRSHGQPVPGVRNAAMISMSRAMLRAGSIVSGRGPSLFMGLLAETLEQLELRLGDHQPHDRHDRGESRPAAGKPDPEQTEVARRERRAVPARGPG